MADIKRTGTAVWRGDLRGGRGTVSTGSAVLKDQAYTFATRFQDVSGTNPEELIAAAHAGCYNMAFASALTNKGYEVEEIETTATIHLSRQEGGFAITRSVLQVRGRVPEIHKGTFERLAEEAERACPVSNLLRPGLEIELEAVLA
ncbi:MAG: OsmC family protein [Chloroflexota bacterium]